ncbi:MULTISPECIES: hypothetical protein [unclassified Vibrio]|uniref:Uncharacterized protein n=1 Tax=Vibrio sp. HB236076 TaxID=3232307 RepID=A0AB39HFN9_9VIBR|nr:hypothetical protein [Vibrio sp. HB161653]MDP5255524.1 hypothetical protein [Vibrio sp. HB161653]
MAKKQSAILGLTLIAQLATTPMVFAQTKMAEVLDELEVQQCQSQLMTIADEVIGQKSHRLHVDQPKGNADKYPLTVVGIISYHDRDAHIQFNATPLANNQCEVSYIEAFALPESCLEVREQVFKKWKYVGKLSDDSFFLRHKERLTKNATLSSINHGTGCLVTRRHSGIE